MGHTEIKREMKASLLEQQRAPVDRYRWNGGTTCYAVACGLTVCPRPPVLCYVQEAV